MLTNDMKKNQTNKQDKASKHTTVSGRYVHSILAVVGL